MKNRAPPAFFSPWFAAGRRSRVSFCHHFFAPPPPAARLPRHVFSSVVISDFNLFRCWSSPADLLPTVQVTFFFFSLRERPPGRPFPFFFFWPPWFFLWQPLSKNFFPLKPRKSSPSSPLGRQAQGLFSPPAATFKVDPSSPCPPVRFFDIANCARISLFCVVERDGGLALF